MPLSHSLKPLPAPIVHASRGELPVLLSVPHSGREYPEWLLQISKGGLHTLSTLEDPLVDRLIWRALGLGVGAVVARAPRAAIDCNRSDGEIDPAVVEGAEHLRPSARARGGLGIVPGRTIQHGHLWRRPIDRQQLQGRIDQAHRPYHEAIAKGLGQLVQRFGGAILIDCHSMPPPSDDCPPIIIGDCHGRTAAPWATAEALNLVRSDGFAARANIPFAGGYIIAHHGQPRRGIHALQLEIDRRAYLDVALREPGTGFDRLASLIERLAIKLGETLRDRQPSIAAE